jgi:hypothetical protein
MSVSPIATPRFELVSMSLPFMRLLVARDLAGAEAEIGATVPESFPDDRASRILGSAASSKPGRVNGIIDYSDSRASASRY